jgi:hypothetical protein
MRKLDFVLAYPQAGMSTDHVSIEIPKGFEFESRDSHCLNVLKNIHSGQDAGINLGPILCQEMGSQMNVCFTNETQYS